VGDEAEKPMTDDSLYAKGLAPAPQRNMRHNNKQFLDAVNAELEVWKKNAYHEGLVDWNFTSKPSGEPATDPVLFDAEWCDLLQSGVVKELGVNECLLRFRQKRAEVERIIAHAAKIAEFEAKAEDSGKQVLSVEEQDV